MLARPGDVQDFVPNDAETHPHQTPSSRGCRTMAENLTSCVEGMGWKVSLEIMVKRARLFEELNLGLGQWCVCTSKPKITTLSINHSASRITEQLSKLTFEKRLEVVFIETSHQNIGLIRTGRRNIARNAYTTSVNKSTDDNQDTLPSSGRFELVSGEPTRTPNVRTRATTKNTPDTNASGCEATPHRSDGAQTTWLDTCGCEPDDTGRLRFPTGFLGAAALARSCASTTTLIACCRFTACSKMMVCMRELVSHMHNGEH
jgi:hypothetical protein